VIITSKDYKIHEAFAKIILTSEQNQGSIRVARSKKIKKAKFDHKQFQKRPNPEK